MQVIRLRLLTGLIANAAIFWAAIIFVVFTGFSKVGYGQLAGTLDVSFGSDGKVINTISSEDKANAMVRQTDGKLIIVGTAKTYAPNVSFGVSRMNQDGSLDSTFGGDGSLTVAIEGLNSFGYAVAVQPDGKIVIGGRQGIDFDSHFAVARLNTDGSLDTSFNGTGMKVIKSGTDTVYSILIQPDGKIVLVGTGRSETPYNYDDFTVVRLNSDGSLDDGFDSNGIATTQVSVGNGMDFSYAGVLQPDGKILVTGSAPAGINDQQIGIVRYNSDGSLDTSFDKDGKTMIPLDVPIGIGLSIVLQPDGKIVVGGRSSDYSAGMVNFTLIRLNTDGTLDATFSSDGKVTTPVRDGGGIGEISALAIQSNGKILAAGYSSPSSLHISGIDFTLARYNSDGSLDASFDNDGILIIPITNEEDRARALALDPLSNKIFVAGFSGQNPRRQYEFTLLKLNGDGSRDTTFSTDGVAAAWVGEDYSSQDKINSLATQPDGKIIAVGSSGDSFALARYTSSGTLDSTFSSDGRVGISLLDNVNNQGTSWADAVAVQPDGKIVVVGSALNYANGNYDFVVVRLTADGTLDASFDGDGKFIGSLSNSSEYARGVVIQPDGKILIAGETEINSSKSNFLLARLNSNGSYDSTFRGSGVVSEPVGTAFSGAHSIVLQPDGRIIASGYSRTGLSFPPQFAAVRFNTDGILDTSFDGDGKVSGFATSMFSSAIQPDGKIIFGGSNTNAFVVLRLLTNGAIDTDFGTGGIIVTTSGYYCEGRKMALQGDGKIVMAGFIKPTQSTESDFMLVRYTADGKHDASFGTNGIVTTPMISGVDEAYAIAIQLDGKILAAGKAKTPRFADDFAIARYFSGFPSTAKRNAFDFDGDGKSDISIYRDGMWWYAASSADGQHRAIQFGAPTDKLVPADYDGDGKTDAAVFRDGTWHILKSSDNGYSSVQFGFASDIPQPGDYDGDGKADVAVYRPSDGYWYILNSRDGFRAVKWGAPEDKPVATDFDGDGKTDVAVFRPSDGNWYLLKSRDGFAAQQWGASTDKPVVGDYDGDGKSDYAVYRPSNGTWYVLSSQSGFKSQQWGLSTDKPVPADYDGDGKTDYAVVRDGTWYQLNSTTGFKMISFGYSTDKPVPNSFVQ